MCTAVAKMGDRWSTIDMGRKLGAVPLLGEGAGSPCNNAAWAEAYLHTKWHLDPSSCLATTNMGQKLGGGCAGEISFHLTPTSMPSGISIHPTVWPQYIKVTDRQKGHTGQRSDSIGQSPKQKLRKCPKHNVTHVCRISTCIQPAN